MLKLIEIVILWVYFITPSLLALDTFLASLFNFLNYCLWLRLTDEGSLPEMRVWSILLIESKLKWRIHHSISLFLYTSIKDTIDADR